MRLPLLARLCVPALALGLLALGVRPPQPVPVAAAPIAQSDFAFLAGTWRAESETGVVEEHWLAPAHGTISGMLRWANPQGQVTLLELLTVTIEEGRGIFRWRHFDGVLKPWDSEKDGPSIVTIESWDNNTLVMHAHPDNPGALAKMTYDGSVEGRLTATLEFDAESGRTPIVIAFERVD
jgi:hypothetical protein